MPSKLDFVAELVHWHIERNEIKKKNPRLTLSVHPSYCCPARLLQAADSPSQGFKGREKLGSGRQKGRLCPAGAPRTTTCPTVLSGPPLAAALVQHEGAALPKPLCRSSSCSSPSPAQAGGPSIQGAQGKQPSHPQGLKPGGENGEAASCLGREKGSTDLGT